MHLYFWYTRLVYLKTKMEQQMLCLMHFNCAEVVMKSNYRYTLIYVIVELLQVFFRYTLNILNLKTHIIQISYNPHQ